MPNCSYDFRQTQVPSLSKTPSVPGKYFLSTLDSSAVAFQVWSLEQQQILRLHFRPTKSETMEVEASNLFKIVKWFRYTLKFENHCSRYFQTFAVRKPPFFPLFNWVVIYIQLDKFSCLYLVTTTQPKNISMTPEGFLVPLFSQFLPSQLQTTMHALEFYISEIIQYILFCIWPLFVQHNAYEIHLYHCGMHQ